MKSIFVKNLAGWISIALIFFMVSIPNSGISEESAEVAKGKELFQSKGCVACHTIGGGKLSDQAAALACAAACGGDAAACF